MSLKSFIQLSIILIIIIILGTVYTKYFSNSNKISQENNEQINDTGVDTKIDKNISTKENKETITEKNNLNQKINNIEEIKEIKKEKNKNVVKIRLIDQKSYLLCLNFYINLYS